MRTVMERLADHALKMAEERIEQEKQAEIAEEVAKEIAKMKADAESELADAEAELAKMKADAEREMVRIARRIMSAFSCSVETALEIMQLRHDKAEAVRKAIEQ